MYTHTRDGHTHIQVVQIERERAVKWGKMITNWRKYIGSEKLHRRVTKGIPNSVRGAVWSHVLDIENVRENNVYEVSWWVGGYR